MSWQATAWAKSTRGHRSPGDKLVLMVLADYAVAQTWKCWPSQTTLAQDCGMSKRAVIGSLNELERRGFIQRVRRGNQYVVSVYRLNPTSQACVSEETSPTAPATAAVQVKFAKVEVKPTSHQEP